MLTPRLLVYLAVAVLTVAVANAGPAAATTARQNGRIAFARATCSSTCSWNLVTANADGSRERLLAGPFAQDAFDDHFLANWSPDGSKLAFMAEQKIWEINADGSHPHVVFTPPANTFFDDDPSFTPDGHHLVFTRCCETGHGYSLWTVDTNGHGLRDLTTEEDNGPADTLPQVSPNGKLIVFNRCGDLCAVDIVDRNGRNRRQLTPDGMAVSTTGNFSPSSTEVVFSAHAREGVRSSLWTVRTDGTHLQQITTSGLACGTPTSDPDAVGCTQPRWSPDGRRIIFSGSGPDGSDIYTVRPNGTGLVQVTHDGGDDSPTWGSR
jgi:TolB protein